MKTYKYQTKVGTFYIRQKKGNPNLFQLWIEDEFLGGYSTPNLAAGDVYTHTTGFYYWDRLERSADTPKDISDWEVIKV
ncbi:MAG: hypothetical protein N3D80_02750 [Ignavibacterium album]|jgi:hypothetical protein|uniref:hypothetical protein n=1 Tax=Ignavibacterium album TaxID=591197 RepID=UPI0026F11976|nr:hypothetical protein [Ignavibacterium album]MCX8104777.1 hypothetical protein [Ignavibacterium album]